MNVMMVLFVPKIQNALILLVNISASVIQDWIYVKLNGCIMQLALILKSLGNPLFI